MNTGVGSLSLLQGIFPTQELNLDLLHYRQILYKIPKTLQKRNKKPKFKEKYTIYRPQDLILRN